MNTTDEQVLEAAPAPEVTEPVQPEPATAEQGDIGEVSFDDLPTNPDEIQSYLYGDGKLELPAAKEPKEAEKALEEKPAEKLEEEPEVLDLDKPLPNRIPTGKFAAEDKKAIQLQHLLNGSKTEGDPGFVTLREAMAKLDGMTPGKAAEPPVQSPVETITSKVTEAEAQLATLRQQKKEAIEFGTDTGDIEDQIDATRDAITAEKVRLAIEQDRAERQQAQEVAAKTQSAQQLRAAAHAQAMRDFPDLAKEGTPLRAAVLQAIEERKDPAHEEHSLLKVPKAPRHMLNAGLEILAEKEGITFEQAVSKYAAKAPVVTQPKPATAQPKKALPASGSQATQPPKGEASYEELLAQGEKDPSTYAKALYGNRRITALQ